MMLPLPPAVSPPPSWASSWALLPSPSDATLTCLSFFRPLSSLRPAACPGSAFIFIQVLPPTDMGRRKSKRKPPPKKKMTGTLETQFTCPFCNHEKSCDVKMDRARNTGVISCTVCLEEFQTPITSQICQNPWMCTATG
ncbi:transcription elongation factor 1 homolog isoform X2 [Carlito syrichta]|uniref:Transcription elongation factor 1 homolog n=1 Tax=Carlito syrichta TaxID=1868482 RepID=A0A1U7T193_CARSF|nr:transcription elongation factor 1 homolog isoform X2 [Carlito syrichta]